ncbi:transglutaminase domain-containing protein [Saccharothrix sp. NRRL B-16314]|uniref:transglutaminase domain-containing protein n=1 Tax=Saccharothrix sp. NRRL B-16314 TaxID=1463825 RepID=UPI00068DEB60|nr:transglutaminase domain-containing protein [Saccharothrix sp. NRRL B-16314]
MTRGHAVWLLLATAVPGLLFAPVFGLWALVPPVAGVVVACYVVFELCLRFPALLPWRPLLALVAGALALIEVALFDTTRSGLPTPDSLSRLAAGVTDSWQLTLQSTWPVRPEPELLLFVPLLVLFTASVGIELLRRPAASVLPSLVLLLLSQTFIAVSGTVATLVALAYAVAVAGLFVTPTRTAVALTVGLSVVAGVAVVAVPTGPAYSVRQNQFAQVPLPREVSPLAEVAARLADPEAEVFRYTSDDPVDRWRLVVLDGFDGVTWTAGDRYRRMGAEIGPPAGTTVPTAEHSARIKVPGGQRWLPSQAMPTSVSGAVRPFVDQDAGTLLLPQRGGPVEYDLRWREPFGDLAGLADAAVSSDVPTGDLGTVRDEVAQLARTATRDARPTFRTALVLEQYLSDNYKVATGSQLPTGSGWPQLREFLLDTKRGTSEQFAASYVVLARIVGIPARLAVGYRAPREPVDGETVVRNKDVLAWPEVAVEGVGWVPLDPAGAASDAGPAPTKLAEVMAKARAELPPPDEQLPDPPVSEPPAVDEGGSWTGIWTPALWALAGMLALFVVVLLAVPVAKLVRTARRKRLTGARGVVGAWWEARDLLRAHGTRITPGMTARDLAAVSGGAVVDSLRHLAVHLDAALWSGEGADEGRVRAAWKAVAEIRGALAGRSFGARIRAVFVIR